MSNRNKYKYSIKGLNDFLNKNDKQFNKEKDIQWESDMGIEYLVSEANAVIVGMLNEKGLSWDQEFIFVDWDNWAPEIVTIIVMEAYDGLLKDSTIWEDWDLGGDDDVDYNSSYIDCVIAAIEFAREHGYTGLKQ